jgi:hypothetical protein
VSHVCRPTVTTENVPLFGEFVMLICDVHEKELWCWNSRYGIKEVMRTNRTRLTTFILSIMLIYAVYLKTITSINAKCS